MPANVPFFCSQFTKALLYFGREPAAMESKKRSHYNATLERAFVSASLNRLVLQHALSRADSNFAVLHHIPPVRIWVLRRLA
jgi:hypothetical protein